MKWIFLTCGLLIGSAGAFVGGIYWERQSRGEIDDQIIFWEKQFYDTGSNVAYPMVIVSGTLTGDPELAQSNNTYVVSCHQSDLSCDVSHVEQIGPKQVGPIDIPQSYSIKKWDQDEIVAYDEGTGISCVKTTITIERRAKTLLWVEEPINQARPMCKYADTNIRKYTIEDSPSWKKLLGKKN
jgi:hypothetical protein